MPSSHFVTCPLCEAMCGLTVETIGARVVSIRGDGRDPFSRGHLCPKAVALQDVHEDPDRLRRPLRRDGASWHEIDWDEALDHVASRLARTQDAHGRDAVAVYVGNPTVHSLGAMLFTPRFIRSLRTRNRFSATSVDQLPHMVVAHEMFGHQLLLPVPDIDRTDHLLVFGANPVASNGSLLTAPGIEKRLKALRARGGRLVVFDPRRTETAAMADAHHAVRPGTDALVLLALLHTISVEGLHRPGPVEGVTDGFDDVRELATRFPPERVEAATGIEANTLRQVARDFARAERAACYGRVGASTQQFGSLTCWLITVLNTVTGRLDAVGGVMFTRPAIDLVGRHLGRGHLGRWRSRVRGLPEFAGELPVAALAEEIDTPGSGQVRALVTAAGNPVLSTPDGARLDRALSSLDFMVSIDIYLNETTRHAHVILPPTSPLERDHYDLVFHALAVRNTAKWSPAVFAPPAGARHDWQILNALAWRLERRGPVARARAWLTSAALAWMGPPRMVDLALRAGPYGTGWRPLSRGLRLGRLRRAPHGLDFGALVPCLPQRLFTPDKRIRLAPAALLAEGPRLERALLDAERPVGLVLIGRRDLRSNNSWMHNSTRLVKGPERCTLLMHPDDAARLGLSDHDRVTVRSNVSAVDVILEVSTSIAPGVVCLPHGFGHGRPGTRLAVAAGRPGASFNDLTDPARVDAVSGNAVLTGVRVVVTRSPATA